MKVLSYVILKDGSEEYVNRKVSDVTFYDLQTKGKVARKNILRVLRDSMIDYKDVKTLVFEDEDKYIDMYNNNIYKLSNLCILTNKSYPSWKVLNAEVYVDEKAYSNCYELERVLKKHFGFDEDEYISTMEYDCKKTKYRCEKVNA